MSVKSNIETKLAEGLRPLHLEVVNESDQHNVPPGSESHFKVVLVSNEFEGKSLVAQHRMVYALLERELERDVHALALHTYTEQSWHRQKGGAPMSPPCLGGKAQENS